MHACYSSSSAGTTREQCLIEQTQYAHYTLYNCAYFVGLLSRSSAKIVKFGPAPLDFPH